VTGPQTETVVMKFGGSSVDGPDEIRRVARRLVAARERGLRVVGTISAMGRTTDALLDLARRVSPSPAPRELDMLLSTGERTACALVAMAIHDLGHEAVSFTGSQAGILTDAAHTKAKIREITPVRVLQGLEEGKIVLVAGFQGFSRETMDVTTLGRGGTDTTAVALAAALGASCEIYSDVTGVFTADPRIVRDARRLPFVTYDEMLEMSGSGARVLMLRAVELARAHGVHVHARSSFSDEPGTVVADHPGMDRPAVVAVTHARDAVLFDCSTHVDAGVTEALFTAFVAERVDADVVLARRTDGEAGKLSFAVGRDDAASAGRALGQMRAEVTEGLAKVSLVGSGMACRAGIAASVFRTLADAEIDVRWVSTSAIRITCLVADAGVERAVRALHDAFGLAHESRAATNE
jgi:aspartate kinase